MTPEDRELLDLFCKKAYRCNGNIVEHWEAGGKALDYNYAIDQPLTLKHVEDYLELMSPVLFPFRQFISLNESIYFPTICEKARPDMTEPEREALELRCNAFRRRMGSSGNIQVGVDGKPVVPQVLIQLLLYSSSFHSDMEKRRELEWHLRSSWSPLLFLVFESSLLRLNEVILSAAILIDARLLSVPKRELPGLPA